MESNSIPESLTIEKGLGPFQSIQDYTLDIKPLTVLVGPQGTGKSLISQFLYFFRDARYLLARYRTPSEPETTVRRVLEGIRSGDLTGRALASFLTTQRSAHIDYTGPGENKKIVKRSLTIDRDRREIKPVRAFKTEVQEIINQLADDPSALFQFPSRALFIPAERSFFSRFINNEPALLGHSALPLTMRDFARVLTEANQLFQQWQETPALRPPEAKFIAQWALSALSGEARYSKKGRYAGHWQWVPQGSDQPIELEMASSGQMETWPFIVTAQALFRQDIENRPFFLHIEEPETHLHPAAQVQIVKLLAYLVNRGFKIVITTHSLTVLYTLNNLILAHQKLGEQPEKDVPEPEFRLNPDLAAAYLFSEGTIENIVMPDVRQIDESRLGIVLGELQLEYNRLNAYGILWGKNKAHEKK